MQLILKNKNHDEINTIYGHRLSKTSEHQTLTLKHINSIKSQLMLSLLIKVYVTILTRALFRFIKGLNLKIIKSRYQRIIKWVSPKQNIRLLVSNLKQRKQDGI